MLDIKEIRKDYEGVKKAVERRGKGDFGLSNVPDLDRERRELLAKVEQMKNRQNIASKEIPKLKKKGLDTTEIMTKMKELSAEIKMLDSQVSDVEKKLKDTLLGILNVPDPRSPESKDIQ